MALGGEGGGGGGQSIKAGAAHVEFSAKDAGLTGFLDQMERRFTKFGGRLMGVGGALMGLGAAVLGPIAGIFTEVVGHFDSVNDAADRLGTTTEAISGLGYAAKLAGSSMEEVEGAAGIMQKQLFKAPEAFDAIGLSAEELKKMKLEDQFLAISDAVSELDDVSRGPALKGIFGKSGANLAPMLKDGAAALKAAIAEGGIAGEIVNGEDAKNAAKVGDAIDKSWMAVKNTFRAVGAAFLPLGSDIDESAGMFIRVTQGIREFVNENRAAIQTVAAVAAGVMAAGAALVGIGGAITVAGFAIGGIMSALAAIKVAFLAVISPVGLVVAAIAVAGVVLAAFLVDTETGQKILGAFGKAFTRLGEIFSTTWGGIKDAIAAGDISGALKIAALGIEVIWADLFVHIQGAWNDFKADWVDGWHAAITEIKVMAAEAAKFLKDQLSGVMNSRLGRAAIAASGPVGAAVLSGISGVAGTDPAETRAAEARRQLEADNSRAEAEVRARIKAREAQQALDNKRKELADNLARQNLAKLGTTFMMAGLGAMVAQARGGLSSAVASMSRTSFGGSNAWQELSVGGSVMAKIEENTKDTADNTKKLKGGVIVGE